VRYCRCILERFDESRGKERSDLYIEFIFSLLVLRIKTTGFSVLIITGMQRNQWATAFKHEREALSNKLLDSLAQILRIHYSAGNQSAENWTIN
jgi:hypothetical protein